MTDQKTNTSRRNFLKTAAATAAAATVFRPTFTIAEEGSKGANERIGVGFIGMGTRGREAHLRIVTQKLKDRCEPVALCDVYSPRFEKAKVYTGDRTLKTYRHYEELLADPKVNVVCIASPDRHHAPQLLAAIRAGKDVYCEKPLTHWSQTELALQIANEAQKLGRVVQVGSQFTADEAYAKARKLIEEGIVGKIVHVQAGYFRRGNWDQRIKIPDPNAKPGPDLDWDAFLGDAPKVEFSLPRFFRWRLFWDYAGGPATDLLVHAYSPAFKLMDLGFPNRVMGGGGTFQYTENEIPDQCNIMADYTAGPSVVLMNSLSNFSGIETILRGTDGVIKINDVDHMDQSKGIRIVPAEKGAKETIIPWTVPEDVPGEEPENIGDKFVIKHWNNFSDCVKSRQKPYYPLDMAVRVQAVLNMGVLSYRENKVARFDKEKNAIVL